MTGHTQLDAAIQRVLAALREGLKHGFFEYRLVDEMVHGRKRQLVVEAGKKYKFTIGGGTGAALLGGGRRLLRRERHTATLSQASSSVAFRGGGSQVES